MEKLTLNTGTPPVTQPACPRTYEIPLDITRKVFEGFRRQGMSVHQAVCEIVDDALAAALSAQALVSVAFAADENKTVCISPSPTGAAAWTSTS